MVGWRQPTSSYDATPLHYAFEPKVAVGVKLVFTKVNFGIIIDCSKDSLLIDLGFKRFKILNLAPS